MKRYELVPIGVLILAATAPARPVATKPSAPDLLARTRAAYAALRTYADTGTVENVFGPAAGRLRETYTFQTAYRAPRQFYFDFVKTNKMDRFVVWSDETAFHTWWQTTGVKQDFPKGTGAAAFTTGAQPTHNALLQIAPLILDRRTDRHDH